MNLRQSSCARLLLARLLPLVVKNFNLVELGPRGTGKTFALRELSPKVYVLSGGKVTDAQLRGSLQTGRTTPGLLASYQVVNFDEIGKTKVPDTSFGGILQDYAESGNFGRSGVKRMSDCSIVLGGNIDLAPNGRGPVARSRRRCATRPSSRASTPSFRGGSCPRPPRSSSRRRV